MGKSTERHRRSRITQVQTDKENAYAAAETALAEGNTVHAAMLFGAAVDYSDARERSLALWNEFGQRPTICAGRNHTAGIRGDGTAVVVGANDHEEYNVVHTSMQIYCLTVHAGHTLLCANKHKSAGVALSIPFDTRANTCSLLTSPWERCSRSNRELLICLRSSLTDQPALTASLRVYTHLDIEKLIEEINRI